MFWGTDYIKHLHKNCEISSWIELSNSAYISFHYSLHLEIRTVSFEKNQRNTVFLFSLFFFLWDILRGTRGYEWHINETKMSFSSVHSSLYKIRAVHLLYLLTSSSIFLHSVQGSKCVKSGHHPASVLSRDSLSHIIYAKSRLLTLASKASLIYPQMVTGPYFQSFSPSYTDPVTSAMTSGSPLWQAFLFIQMSPSQRWPFLNTLSKTVPHPYPFNVDVRSVSHFFILKSLVSLFFTCLSIL